jgi:hypothetical protein
MAELTEMQTAKETEGLEPGLPDNPVDLVIATAKADALEMTRKTIGALLECASDNNAARVLRAVENVASNQRDLIRSLKGGKPKRRGRAGRMGYRAVGEYLPDDDDDDLEDATGALVANFQSGDNETFGAQVMRQLVGFFRGPAEGLELKGLLESLKVAKDAGLTDEADQIKAKLKGLLGDDAGDLDLDDIPKPPLAPPSVEGYVAAVGYREADTVKTLTANENLPRDSVGIVEQVNESNGVTVLLIDFGDDVGLRTIAASRVSLVLSEAGELATDEPLLCAARCGRVLPVTYVESGEDTCPECIAAQAEVEDDEANPVPMGMGGPDDPTDPANDRLGPVEGIYVDARQQQEEEAAVEEAVEGRR